jgi:hypothetical protein
MPCAGSGVGGETGRCIRSVLLGAAALGIGREGDIFYRRKKMHRKYLFDRGRQGSGRAMQLFAACGASRR